jgi:hypothetical protein
MIVSRNSVLFREGYFMEHFAFLKREVSRQCTLNKALYCPTEVRTKGRVSCGMFPLFK